MIKHRFGNGQRLTGKGAAQRLTASNDKASPLESF